MPTWLSPTLLFLHIISALGLFAVTGASALALHGLRSADRVDALRAALDRLMLPHALAKPLPPLLLLSGLGLCWLTWGFRQPWVLLSLAGFLTIAVLMQAVLQARLKRLERQLENGADFEHVAAMLRDRLLWRVDRLCNGLLLWLVFLMTVKPGLVLALAALALVLAAALLWPLRAAAPRRTELPAA